jgi:UDP-N-acetylglucosamine:LPS N-acetylglucosamine transferase
MHRKCDILILTANFGSGHISVSKAIENYIKDTDESLEIETVDMYKIIRPKLHKYIYRCFTLLIKYAVHIYNYDYYKKNNNDKLCKLHSCFRSSSRRLARYMEEVQPSIIISTFPTCSAYITKYKQDNNVNTPLITCITDIVKGSEWMHKGSNLYLVATDTVKTSLIDRGISKDNIVTTGIPIRRDFITPKNRDIIRRNNKISEDDFVILMMGGGMGLIPKQLSFYKWINNQKKIKLIIITGNNNKLYNKISKYDNYSNITIMKYTNKVSEIMTMSDLLITKPGGITLFEAISSKLPFIIYKPILGQEIENCKYIEKKQLGYIVSTENELQDRISTLMKDKLTRDKIINNLEEEYKNIDMELLAHSIMNLYNTNE